MENARTLNALDEFAKAKPKEIPKELDEYLRHVAASGDPIYQWSLVKFLFRQKLLNVIMDFYESCPMIDLPFNANLDPFNFETVKKRLLERYDFFTGVPFTIQRLAELLTSPKKQYNRLDKFLRALEKNIWVVSTREPASHEGSEQTNLPNGVLSSIQQSNDVDDNQEEEEDTTRNSSLVEGTQDTALPVSEDTEPPVPEEEEEEDDEDAVSLNSNEPVAEADSECDTVHETGEIISPTDAPIDNLTTDNCEVTETENLSKLEEEEEVSLDKNDEPCETNLEDVTPVDDNNAESKEEEKAEAVVSAEVEDVSASNVSDDTIEPIVLESTTVEEVPKKDDRSDLKRKIDHVIDEDEVIAPKKLETEQPYIETELENKPISPIEDIASEVIESVEDDKVDERIDVAEAVEITEIEGHMESSEVDEKIEMVVEETEQAMDVDESSILSPMVQEDVVELMEATEMGSS